LTPAPTLNWTPCYTAPLECCRFEVPLDYSNPDGAKAAIAMIRIPSTLPTNSTEYRGPLLFNPGGPGGRHAGIDFWTQDTGEVQSLSDAVAGAYDFVTFDPRDSDQYKGVGRSTPQVQRFPDELSSALWGEISLATLLPALSIPGNIGLTIAKSIVTNAIFGQNAASYLRNINTPNTATDMLQIVQAYGQEKITYYGTSYGTALGTTFATMYPDKIERMILDGVFDAEAYYAGNYTASMLDTDAALDTFFQTCYEAGPDRCAVYDSSPTRISDNFDAFHEQLKTSPLPVFNNETSYGILDYTTARHFARVMLYTPFSSFPAYAEALALAQKGNGSALYALAGTPNSFTCNCANATNPDNSVDALIAITCNDAVMPDMTIADWEQYYAAAAHVSKLSDVYVGLSMRCSGWPIPNEEKLSPKSIGVSNTSFPILFISNTLDPVTPHANAEKMSGLFPGSALLMQNTTGHASVSANSNCTLSAFAEYLVNGTLPAAGTVCQVEGSFFP
ncbi:hypothetical protein PENSPDRAFT_576805, partial [Peniophora sp. CONT]